MSLTRGFSLLELLVVIAIISIIGAMLLAAISEARSQAQSVVCISNLHQIAIGLDRYGNDHRGILPNPAVNGVPWDKCLEPYLQDMRLFQCTADQELYASVGCSYDWRDTGVANTTLAGRRLTDVNRSEVILVFESLPGWHLRGFMNAAMVDGSARTMDREKCMSDLMRPVR